MPNTEQFPEIFARLKKNFEPFASRLVVAQDDPAAYTLNTSPSTKYPQGFFVSSVQIKKNYVSYHLMPVYMFPDLFEGISERLKKRMQGKSCFNFTTTDEALFAELGQLTAAGFERFRQERPLLAR